MSYTIGVDVGGSKISAGVVDVAGRVLTAVEIATPSRSSSPVVVENAIVGVVERLRSTHEVTSVGVGAAGFVDVTGSSVCFSPHLSWRNEPLAQNLSSRIGLPVIVDNDANTAAEAEMRFGAGRGHRQVVCVMVGTGIGGALVLGGHVLRGANGMAGEFGHMQVVPDGRPCECGNRGCWEQYASGNALVRAGADLMADRSPAASLLRSLVDDDPVRLTGPGITEAARSGDLGALALFEDIGGWLGSGLASLCAAFDPELVIVGGGVSEADDLLLVPARRALHRNLTGRGYRPEPPVAKAFLGNRAGLIGAAELGRTAQRSRVEQQRS